MSMLTYSLNNKQSRHLGGIAYLLIVENIADSDSFSKGLMSQCILPPMCRAIDQSDTLLQLYQDHSPQCRANMLLCQLPYSYYLHFLSGAKIRTYFETSKF